MDRIVNSTPIHHDVRQRACSVVRSAACRIGRAFAAGLVNIVNNVRNGPVTHGSVPVHHGSVPMRFYPRFGTDWSIMYGLSIAVGGSFDVQQVCSLSVSAPVCHDQVAVGRLLRGNGQKE